MMKLLLSVGQFGYITYDIIIKISGIHQDALVANIDLGWVLGYTNRTQNMLQYPYGILR
ncbi:hypothetical protein [Moraxella equi]|uniref:hypothetical protein n=1 Tax=Moraxella equi TaxID=60442 RepID=UPI00142DA763|nr:hypothetical protein [Moraxella equi]